MTSILAKAELSVDQQIRLTAVECATQYYAMKMRLMKSGSLIHDSNGEHATVDFAKMLANYIKNG